MTWKPTWKQTQILTECWLKTAHISHYNHICKLLQSVPGVHSSTLNITIHTHLAYKLYFKISITTESVTHGIVYTYYVMPTCWLDYDILLVVSSCFEKDFLGPRIKLVLGCTSFLQLKMPCRQNIQNKSCLLVSVCSWKINKASSGTCTWTCITVTVFLQLNINVHTCA